MTRFAGSIISGGCSTKYGCAQRASCLRTTFRTVAFIMTERHARFCGSTMTLSSSVFLRAALTKKSLTGVSAMEGSQRTKKWKCGMNTCGKWDGATRYRSGYNSERKKAVLGTETIFRPRLIILSWTKGAIQRSVTPNFQPEFLGRLWKKKWF